MAKCLVVCYFVCVIQAYASSTEQSSDVLGNMKNELEIVGNEISVGFKKVETGILNEFQKLKHEIEKNPDMYDNVKNGLKVLGNKISDGFKEAETVVVNGYHKAEDAVDNTFEAVKTTLLHACECTKYSCGCCAHLEEPQIELNATICTNITYLVHDYGISFTVTVNHYTLFNETVSARNPPPVCLGLPYVKELADVCVRLYDIDATKTYLHACIKIEARMKKILIAQYDLGCINIGPLAEVPEAIAAVPEKKLIGVPTQMIPTEKEIEEVFQRHSMTAQSAPNMDLIIVIGSDEIPNLTTMDTIIDDDESDYARLEEPATSKSPNLILPIVASLIAIVLVSILALVVYITIKKRRDERRLKLQFMKQYGSTSSLVSHMDPYC